jgi:hypothetical protein
MNLVLDEVVYYSGSAIYQEWIVVDGDDDAGTCTIEHRYRITRSEQCHLHEADHHLCKTL